MSVDKSIKLAPNGEPWAIALGNLGKAYKRYPSRWSRLAEWLRLLRVGRAERLWLLRLSWAE